MQLTLDGRTALDRSIDILREYEPGEGYYLAFSGGQHSVTLKAVADMAGVKYDAHYCVTTVDPPELTRFILREFPDVQWDMPRRNFYDGVRSAGLPTRVARWCCRELKEVGGVGRVVLTGILAEESAARAKRGMVQMCAQRQKWFINPLHEWSQSDVEAFREEHSLPHCSLYTEGWDRIGCVICPFNSQVERSMERWPGIWRATRRAAGDYYARSEACQKRWRSAEAFWQWWIHRNRAYPLPRDERPPTLSFEDADE